MVLLHLQQAGSTCQHIKNDGITPVLAFIHSLDRVDRQNLEGASSSSDKSDGHCMTCRNVVAPQFNSAIQADESLVEGIMDPRLSGQRRGNRLECIGPAASSTYRHALYLINSA